MKSDKVFTTEDGSPLDPNDVSDWFEDLTIEAGYTIFGTAQPR